MPEPGLIMQLSSLGLGGVIAAVVLVWKRQDDKNHKNDMKDFFQRMENVTERMFDVTNANTEAMRSIRDAVDTLMDIDKLEEKLKRSLRAKE